MDAKTFVCSMLEEANIRVGGDRDWDITVHNEDLYARILRYGTIGAGEAYVEGWWDCPRLDTMFCKAIKARLEATLRNRLPELFLVFCHTLFNMQTIHRSTMVAEQHYNFSNTMFSQMLGPSMNYSCGYWKDAQTLDDAEYAKMELICQKLQLREGMSVLDIGCGWGGLCQYMVEHYGVKATGITVSTEQFSYAKEHDPEHNITWLLQDYRLLRGRFERIVSVGMFEHVGRKNYDVYFDTVRNLLDPKGLFLLHTIGSGVQKSGADPWINKYIFPNGVLPSMETLTKKIRGKFVLEDWHNFGADYDKTLMAWYQRFEKGYADKAFSCTPETRRMYDYYLLSCAGAFRARDIHLWQLVLSPDGVEGGYCSCR